MSGLVDKIRTVRASRLVSLLLLLQTRGQLTAPELAEELEVSVRTVYRDVEALSAAGVPGYAEAGRGGGFPLLQGYPPPLTGLSAKVVGGLVIRGRARDGETRPSRLSRIGSARVLNEESSRPPEFDLPAYWADSVSRFEVGAPRLAVTLRATGRAIAALHRHGCEPEPVERPGRG